MLPSLLIAISAPQDVYVAECEQFGVWISGDDFFETSLYDCGAHHITSFTVCYLFASEPSSLP